MRHMRRRNGKPNDGKLFYSVILASQACDLGAIGLNNQPVHSVHYKDVGALVSNYPKVDSIKLLRKNLGPYHQVNRKAAEHFTTIPARFGQIATDAGQVGIALRKHYPLIRKELGRLDGKVEMGIKAHWDVDDVSEYFIRIDDKLSARKERLMKGGKHVSQMDLIDFGRYFHDRLSQFKREITDKILDALPFSEVRIEEIQDDKMVANVALLIQKDHREQFEEAFETLGELLGDEYSLRLDGPWAPFSFVDRLELQL